jgi:hypothetical protein
MLISLIKRLVAAFARVKSQVVNIFSGGGPGPPPGGR